MADSLRESVIALCPADEHERLASCQKQRHSSGSLCCCGDCYDNVVGERFFWSLKHEWTKHENFANLEEARRSVFKSIEVFYNRQRLHQSLGYKTPEQYEADNAPATAT